MRTRSSPAPTPLDELTALPGPSSWWGGVGCPFPKESSPRSRPFGPCALLALRPPPLAPSGRLEASSVVFIATYKSYNGSTRQVTIVELERYGRPTRSKLCASSYDRVAKLDSRVFDNNIDWQWRNFLIPAFGTAFHGECSYFCRYPPNTMGWIRSPLVQWFKLRGSVTDDSVQQTSICQDHGALSAAVARICA